MLNGPENKPVSFTVYGGMVVTTAPKDDVETDVCVDGELRTKNSTKTTTTNTAIAIPACVFFDAI